MRSGIIVMSLIAIMGIAVTSNGELVRLDLSADEFGDTITLSITFDTSVMPSLTDDGSLPNSRGPITSYFPASGLIQSFTYTDSVNILQGSEGVFVINAGHNRFGRGTYNEGANANLQFDSFGGTSIFGGITSDSPGTIYLDNTPTIDEFLDNAENLFLNVGTSTIVGVATSATLTINSVAVTVIPEPTTAGIACVGMVSLLARRRRSV